jgi:uncharacterized protein YbjT (DUF2867 family)
VLVTGATGNVGREVVRELQKLSIPCVAAVPRPERARSMLGDQVPTVRLDLLDPSTFDAAMQGVRGLFLLRPPAISTVEQTLNLLLDTAASAGVKHVTFLSVEGADRQRWIPHRAVEEHILASGLSHCILRPGFFAQNLGDAYRADIQERDELHVPAGAGRVAFVDVRDVAEIAARSFADPQLRNHAWTLTGPDSVSFAEVAASLSRALGRPIRYRRASIPAYVTEQWQRGLAPAQIGVLTVLHVGLRFGNGSKVDPALRRLLGRAPRTLEDYIRDHVSLWKKPPADATRQE